MSCFRSAAGINRTDGPQRKAPTSLRIHTSVVSAMARASVLPITAAASLLSSRLILGAGGSEPFAFYALLVSIPMLVPFLDFGLGAAVVNAAAKGDSGPGPHLDEVFVSAGQLLLRWSAVGALIMVAIGLLGLWEPLLGTPSHSAEANWVATACFVLLMANVPLSLGARVLVGSGKNHWAILSSALTGALSAPLVLLFVHQEQVGSASIAFFVALTIANLTSSGLAMVAQPSLRTTLSRLLKRRRPAVQLRRTSLPMFVQIAAGSIAIHADRLLLSHLSSTEQLNQYYLSSQLYLAVLSLVSAAGLSLWPIYASRSSYTSPLRASAIFTVSAGLMCAATFGIAPRVLEFASAGVGPVVSPTVHLGWAVMIMSYACIYPIGMSLNDESGLAFQVPFQLLALAANIGATLLLIPLMGAAGPLFASALAISVCQTLPLGIYAARRSRQPHAVPEGATPSSEVVER